MPKKKKEYELCRKESTDSSQNAATSGTAKEGQSLLKTGVNQTTDLVPVDSVETQKSGFGASLN